MTALGTDPYREHPLHECERATSAPGVPLDTANVTVPAPLPGYALAVFAVLASLPFGLCAIVWVGMSLAALGATSALLRQVIALPALSIAVAVCLPAAVVAIPLGQPTPLVGCAIAACAYGLHRGRWRLAAIAALTTALEPQIAIVLCATLLVAVPATRSTIIIGTAVLTLFALVVLGVDINIEYVRNVLHAQVVANIAERSQYSTTHFAWALGAARGTALLIGNVWYICAGLAGLCAALRLRSRYGLAALALVPPAFAVCGGLYVHFSQLTLAIPAYLMTLGRLDSSRRWLARAIFILAVPWIALTAFPPFAFALVVLALDFSGGSCTTWRGFRLGLASAGLLVGFFALALVTMNSHSPQFHLVVSANPLAQTAWGRYVAWRDPAPNLVYLLLQLPTVVAFTVCLSAVVLDAVAGRQGSRAAPASAAAKT